MGLRRGLRVVHAGVIRGGTRGLTVGEIERMKRNADRAARVLTAENNRDAFLDLVRSALGGPTSTEHEATSR